MKINEIENYLSIKNTELNQDILKEIEEQRVAAIGEKDEALANRWWCLITIYSIQNHFVKAFYEMKSGEYEAAWSNLDSADIQLSGLSQNFDLGVDNDKYHLLFISNILREYQSAFPYQYFFSRECVIKEEVCSICGNRVLLRKSCGHRLGKLYMGEQCAHKVTDLEFKAIALVTEPFDKYTYVKIDGKEYDYGMVEMLLSGLEGPYDKFWIETKMVKSPEYIRIGRNALCPCGSGKKYKRCHLGKKDELIKHHIVHFTKPVNDGHGIRYFGTWKD